MQLNSRFRRRQQKLSRIFVCSFFLSLVFVVTSRAQSDVFAKWVSRFDAAHESDAPTAMVVDGKGHTFVTGSTCVNNNVCQESLTIAYNSEGNVIWKAFLSVLPRLAVGLDLAVDSAGNVYVLSVLDPIGSPEVATAKYSPTGVREWINFIATTSSTRYRPVKLAVAPEGNVYVAMTAEPNTNPTSATVNAITVKYDTNGNRIWAKEVVPIQNTAQSPVFIRLDAAENVYVLVYSAFSSQIQDSFIVKYEADGTLLDSYGSDHLGKIDAFRVDGSGNSYVAGGGTPQAPHGAQDRIVAKFSTAGILDWLHDFGAEAAFDQSGFADLAIDSSGDVLVAQSIPGSIPSSNGTDISVVKFNSTGTLQWMSRYNTLADDSGNDQAVAVAVNSLHDTYITGSTSNPSVACCENEFATLKYDPNGKQVWVTRYTSPGQGGGAPVALALTGGDVIVTGFSNGVTTAEDWATIDYVQDATKVSLTSLGFGDQKVGTASASKFITVTNTAEVPLSINGISITGNFQLTNNCPVTLAAGAACTVGVKFVPSQAGSLAGTVTVRDNWSGSSVHPQTVQLTGTGIT